MAMLDDCPERDIVRVSFSASEDTRERRLRQRLHDEPTAA